MKNESLRRPIIGIAPSVSDGKIKMSTAYAKAVFRAGGIPFFLPYTDDSAMLDGFASLDGFLYAGGVDVDPARYGEEVLNDTVEINPVRDEFEFALWERIYPTGKPIFGICRGIQSINVALGGSLYQDIAGHRQTESGPVVTQSVKIEPGSRLFGIIGSETAEVNSFHHQAIKRAAGSLLVTARAEDGTIEAVETRDTGRFLLAVQWHPELLAEKRPEAAALFESFVNAARAGI